MENDALATPYTLLSKLRHRSQGSVIWQDSWREFADRYLPLIYRLCSSWRLQQEDAADISQQVLEKLFLRLNQFDRNQGRFRSWLRAVVRHAWLDLIDKEAQKNRQLAELAKRLPSAVEEDLLQVMEEGWQQEILARALSAVRSQFEHTVYEAFRLTEQEGKTADEAAAVLQVAKTSVYKYRFRVKRRLQEEVAQLRKNEEGSE